MNKKNSKQLEAESIKNTEQLKKEKIKKEILRQEELEKEEKKKKEKFDIKIKEKYEKIIKTNRKIFLDSLKYLDTLESSFQETKFVITEFIDQISLIGKGNSEMNLVRFREKHTPMSVSVHTNLLLALPVEVPDSVPGLVPVPVPVPVALLVPDEMVGKMEVKSMEMEEDFAEEYDSNDVDEEKIEDKTEENDEREKDCNNIIEITNDDVNIEITENEIYWQEPLGDDFDQNLNENLDQDTNENLKRVEESLIEEDEDAPNTDIVSKIYLFCTINFSIFIGSFFLLLFV